jgi:hypothetical protein
MSTTPPETRVNAASAGWTDQALNLVTRVSHLSCAYRAHQSALQSSPERRIRPHDDALECMTNLSAALEPPCSEAKLPKG